MALPKIDLPMFETTLPSTGEKVKYRPFTVKEEKILLVGQESEDVEQQILASRQVINNCLIDKDISTLSMIDLEFLLLSLRSKSVDNKVSFTISDPDTKEKIALELDLEDMTISRDPEHSKEIKINNDYTLYLKYPTIDDYIKIQSFDKKDPLTSYFIMTSCLDKIASEDEVYNFKDYSPDEIDQFMENLQADTVKKIERFFATMPKIRFDIKYKDKTGKEKTFVIEGIKTFFS